MTDVFSAVINKASEQMCSVQNLHLSDPHIPPTLAKRVNLDINISHNIALLN